MSSELGSSVQLVLIDDVVPSLETWKVLREEDLAESPSRPAPEGHQVLPRAAGREWSFPPAALEQRLRDPLPCWPRIHSGSGDELMLVLCQPMMFRAVLGKSIFW